MEALLPARLPPTGKFTYKDQYDTIYDISWQTVPSPQGPQLDITTITKMPYVWGESTENGEIRGNALYRRGIVTIHRQLLRLHESGYMITSEGFDQSIQLFQASSPCGQQPFDPFLYHLNSQVIDTLDIRQTDGPRWADPDNPNDATMTWNDLSWADVWSN